MANQLEPTEPTRPTAEGRLRHSNGGADAEEDEVEQEESLEKLEEEVKEMAEKLAHYRSTFPDQLKSTLASILAAERPELPVLGDGCEPGPSGNPDPGSRDDSSIGVSASKDHETAEKICLLKDKMSNNATAIPVILKRMNECISRIDKLNSSNEIIHPAFKRKKS
ncbi:hypothetical protein Ancab_037034 [Ancistrocladus abbreviatus]